MRLKTRSQNAEIKLTKVQTLTPLFSKPAKLEMEQSSSKAKNCYYVLSIYCNQVTLIFYGVKVYKGI